ncbi:hypothetical protein LPJ56_006173, partial [Coemansia sp. RSA 2599]
RFPSAFPKQRPWLTSPKSANLPAAKRQPSSASHFPTITVTSAPNSAPADASSSRHGLNLTPGAIFSQMPSIGGTPTGFSFSSPQPQPQPLQSRGASRAHADNESDASDTDLTIDDDDEPDDGTGVSAGTKRRRTGVPHKRDQERKFNCDVCHRSFARQYNLKTHRLTHFPNTRESRPFKCPHCVKAFT